MKRGIRIAIFSLLFLGGVAMLMWYFFMKREIPDHARCIPRNAIAVVTFNLRELALNASSGKHLFPELAGKSSIEKELAPFKKAIELNNGSGLKETSDVLAFFYQDGESAFIGVVVEVRDSIKFGNLVRKELAKKFNIQPASANEHSIFRIDTTSVVIGWNQELALLLYPFSNESVEKTAIQCAKLLTQSREQSVLVNEDFQEHELTSFDAGVWIQAKPFLAFTQGGHLFRAALNDINTISLAFDFRDGELDVRNLINTDEKNHQIPYNELPLLSCDSKQVNSFWRIPLDLQNENILDAYLKEPPLNMLPLDEEKTKQLANFLDGNCTILLHDTFSYNMNYLTYDYDEDFNRVSKNEIKRETARGITACFGLKDEKKAKELMSTFMKSDSIPMKDNRWVINDNGAMHYLMISQNILTITNWPQADGIKREVPESWKGLNLFLPIGEYLGPSNNFLLSLFMPKLESGQKLLSENLKLLTISQPMILNNTRTSQIRLIMANKQVNSMTQLIELFGKIMEDVN